MKIAVFHKQGRKKCTIAAILAVLGMAFCLQLLRCLHLLITAGQWGQLQL